MDDERIAALEDELSGYESRIIRLQTAIETNQKLARAVREALAPVYLARWQQRTGSTLAPGDKLLVTAEFRHTRRGANDQWKIDRTWPLGGVMTIEKMHVDGETVYFQLGIDWGRLVVPDWQIVERMRAAYLAQQEAT